MTVFTQLLSNWLASERFVVTEDDAGHHLYAKFGVMRIHLSTVSHAEAKTLEKSRLQVVS